MGRRMSHACSYGERRIRGTGDERKGSEARSLNRRLRYKISACHRCLKSLKILKARRNRCYKISGATNRLF